MNGIRPIVLLITLLAVLAVSLGPFTAPAFADDTADNGQDPPTALPGPVEAVLDDAATFVQVLVSVIL
jgi:hypothetical protein